MSGDGEPQPLPKVLIVDDSRMVRASIIKHIRGRFEFREEADGESAWQALVVDPTIEVVLSDIGMPQLDGYGLLERIRQSRLARLQHLPVLIISGDEDDAARERARRLGADDFITKGIGNAELIARLDSLSRLARTRRELDESRAALASQSPVDPSTGLATPAYLNWHGQQEFARARRHQGSISAMVIEIDHYEQLAQWHGANVAPLIARKLSKILTTRIRQEDTISELAPGRFAVLSPVSDALACCAFALRMQKAIEKLVMTYREERIRISVTVGVASSSCDGAGSVSELIDVAIARMQSGKRAGGNRVVGEHGEVTQAGVERQLRQSVSVDQALVRLKAGDPATVGERLPELVASLLPLFELVESRLRCGMPIERLKQYAAGQAASEGEQRL